MIINDATIELVKEFEGLRLAAYQDSVGVWTIGYGTTAAAGLGITPRKGDAITEAEATRLLNMGLSKFGEQISGYIKVPVNENQYGALVSLAYNIGPGAFSKSTLLKKLNAGDYAGAAEQFLVWNKAGGKVLKGLERRRAAERALFLRPVAVAKKPTLLDLILKLLGIKK